MLQSQTSLPLSPYTALYDLVVPQDDEFRRFNELIDFSFVRDELRSKYTLDKGRMAEDPVRMFKYLILKMRTGLSDKGVVKRSRTDLSFKLFLGLAPEDDVIDASTLCKFRRQRLLDSGLLDKLIAKTVEVAIEQGVLTSKSIIVDSTHTRSRSKAQSPVEVLKQATKRLRKSLYKIGSDVVSEFPTKTESNDLVEQMDYAKALVDTARQHEEELAAFADVVESVDMLEEQYSDIADHVATSVDKDARIGHKTADTSFYGYKEHIAMSPERIITAVVVTSGEKGDGPQLGALVEQSRENGMEVDAVIGDTAYAGKENLALGKQSREEGGGFKVYAPLHPCLEGFRKDEDKWTFNKDADMYTCPAGHLATSKRIQKEHLKHGRSNGNPRIVYNFNVQICKHCPLREGCYKEGAKSKTYSIPIMPEVQAEQKAFQQTEEFRHILRTERYKIEAKNWELKETAGMDQAQSYGIKNMRLQAITSIFVTNLKRIVALKSK